MDSRKLFKYLLEDYSKVDYKGKLIDPYNTRIKKFYSNIPQELLDTWKKAYTQWAKENKHLPNLQEAKFIIDRYKQQMEMQKNRQNSMEGRIQTIEQKLDKLMVHLGVK